MAITPEEAAEIAAEAGLTISDAAALRALADDTDEARTIAAKFASKSVASIVDSIPPRG